MKDEVTKRKREEEGPCEVRLSVPTAWHELDDGKLRWVYGLIASGMSAAELKVAALLRWNGLRVLWHEGGDFGFEKHGSPRHFVASAAVVAECLNALAWMDEPPARPVCLRRLGRHRATAPDFAGVPFESFVVCDNLYQGYLAVHDDALLDQILAVLYGLPTTKVFGAAERISAFYWMMSVKACFARQFPNFFQPAPSAGGAAEGTLAVSPTAAADGTNAMLRALTKGDVTKEAEVLALDTHRALTELDALAREYREFKSKYPN